MKATLPHPPAASRRLSGGLIVLVGLTLLFPVRWSVAQDAPEVSRAAIFAQRVQWCGDERMAADQAPALQEILDLQGSWGLEGMVEGLEQFLEALPDSPWAPSLRINLGRFYFSSGPGFGDVMRGVPGTPHGGGPVVYPRR